LISLGHGKAAEFAVLTAQAWLGIAESTPVSCVAAWNGGRP
jgi:hypothetical protein